MSADPPPSPPSPLEPLAAEAAAAQAADPSHPSGPVRPHCENCGAKLEGPYCHRCGQHDFDVHRSFGHVFLEALENLFHFDGKFFRNIVTLLFRPGALTAEFNAGRRASQMPPFRLYIFTAFIFFLWVFSTGDTSDAFRTGPAPAPGVNNRWTVDGRPVTFEQAMRARNDPAYAEQLRREIAAGPLAVETRARKTAGAERNAFERWADEKGRRVLDPDFQREMARAFISALPKMLLFCLPLFALYTRVLFRRSGQVYLQHLILALHFHTFVFLWWMFRDGWVFLARLPGPGVQGWVAFAGNVWLAVYPVLMLRRLFGNGWKMTLVKALLLACAYFLTLVAAFLLTAVVILLLM